MRALVRWWWRTLAMRSSRLASARWRRPNLCVCVCVCARVCHHVCVALAWVAGCTHARVHAHTQACAQTHVCVSVQSNLPSTWPMRLAASPGSREHVWLIWFEASKCFTSGCSNEGAAAMELPKLMGPHSTCSELQPSIEKASSVTCLLSRCTCLRASTAAAYAAYGMLVQASRCPACQRAVITRAVASKTMCSGQRV